MSEANTVSGAVGSLSVSRPTGRAACRSRRWRRVFLLGCVAFLTIAGTGQGQLDAGTLIGSIADPEGNTLSEVEVTLAGAGERRTVRSDERGEFRIRDLEPGNYSLEAFLEGFSRAVYEPVHIRLGRLTTVRVQMSSAIEETITVTSEPPPPAPVAEAGGTYLGAGELGEVPAASDPFAAATQSPAVLADTTSPGARPRRLRSPGFGEREGVFLVDGVEGGHGGGFLPVAPPRDPGQVSAVEIRSGGADASLASAGVVLDLTTRSGTPELRGSLRALATDGGWQSSSPTAPAASPSAGDDPLAASGALATDRVLDVFDAGAELGGQLLADYLWAWGSHGEQQIRRRAVGGQVEQTRLSQSAAKLNGQLGRSNSLVASYHVGETLNRGRGAGPDRAFESTLEESEPSDLLRIEDSHLLTPRFQLTGLYSRLESGTVLTPFGGSDAEILLGEDGVWRGTFGGFDLGHDAELMRLDGRSVHDSGRFHHEVRAGWSGRDLLSTSSERWGRRNLVHVAGENLGTSLDLVRAVRPANLRVRQDVSALWLQDTVSFGRLTLDAGFRYDHQRGRNEATRVEAHPIFSEQLPALELGPTSAGFEWKTVSPRLGLTWALDRDAETILRASFGSFASQIYADLVSRVSPASRNEIAFFFDDLDQDNLFDADLDELLVEYQVVDPGRGGGGRFGGTHANDPRLQPERTDELRLGVERRLRSDLVVALDLVERQTSGIHEVRHFIVDERGRFRMAHASDYQLEAIESGLLPNGDPFSVPIYSLREGREFTGGSLLANGDRSQRYRGAALSVDKRLSSAWLLRAYVSWNDWRWRVGDGFRSFDDPTDAAPSLGDGATVDPTDDDGAPVLYDGRFPGDVDGRFLNSRWSFNVFSLYQVAPDRPWGFNVAANLHGREGYPVPYSVTVVSESDGAVRSAQVVPEGESFRLDDVYTVDLRLEKEVAFGSSPLRATFSLDTFNLFDEGYVLARERQLNGPRADEVREVMSPRIFRLGVRLTWK